MISNFQNKKVLITGVCGTIGKELLKQVLRKRPSQILGIDNNESDLFFLNEHFGKSDNINLCLCDIRDKERISKIMRDTNIIFHTAALKHVTLCEASPWECIYTNLYGTQNIIDAAIENGVERVLFTSSDKAVNPTNAMGASKLMGEQLITASNACKRKTHPIFMSTRFGNVLGSRGSVIPLFISQIAKGGPVTLTDPKMSRFVMTQKEAVKLMIDSIFLAKGGEVFVRKMPTVEIKTLAEAIIELIAPEYGYIPSEIEIKIVGSKPGEKLYEELLCSEEAYRTVELPEYYVVTPALKSKYENSEYTYPCMLSCEKLNRLSSHLEPKLNKEEIKQYLVKNRIIVNKSEIELTGA